MFLQCCFLQYFFIHYHETQTIWMLDVHVSPCISEFLRFDRVGVWRLSRLLEGFPEWHWHSKHYCNFYWKSTESMLSICIIPRTLSELVVWNILLLINKWLRAALIGKSTKRCNLLITEQKDSSFFPWGLSLWYKLRSPLSTSDQ